MPNLTSKIFYYGIIGMLLTIGGNAMSSDSPQTGPKTLFEIVGAVRPELNLKNSILIIIDAQKEYETGILPLSHVKATIRTIQNILSAAREHGTPVIHVLHEGQKGLFDPVGEGFKSISALAPQAGEAVVRKQLPNAFANTDLKKIIDGLGKNKELVLVGFMTHMCITATAMAALDLGYETFVVRDAVATRSLKGSNGKIISATEVNEASLAALQDRVSWIVSSKELMGKR